MSKSESHQDNTSGGGEERHETETVAARLRETGLDEERFVDLLPGKKYGNVDHTDPANQFVWELVDGNYGVMAGGGLVILDVDHHDELPDGFGDLPETFAVESANGGEHHYFAVEGDVPNSGEDWGDILAQNKYAVGPGSTLDGGGSYGILQNRPIATIGVKTLQELQSKTTNSATAQPDTVEVEALPGDIDIGRRVKVAKESAHGEKFTALWEGRYRDAGYDDRSDAEASLVSYLAFYLEGYKEAVRVAMDLAVSENPTTPTEDPRKWNDPDAGETYRDLTLDLVDEVENEYTPQSSHIPGAPRPETSYLTRKNAHAVLMDLGIASTAEIAEHEDFDRGQRQAKRAMDILIDGGVANYVKDGRQVRYYLDGLEALIPREEREKYDL